MQTCGFEPAWGLLGMIILGIAARIGAWGMPSGSLSSWWQRGRGAGIPAPQGAGSFLPGLVQGLGQAEGFLEITPPQPEQDRGPSEGLPAVTRSTWRRAWASLQTLNLESRAWTPQILLLVGHVESARCPARQHPPCPLRDCPLVPRPQRQRQ